MAQQNGKDLATEQAVTLRTTNAPAQQPKMTAIQTTELGAIIVRRDEVTGGVMTLARKDVPLNAGEHYTMIGNRGAYTLAGALVLNRYAGLSEENPPTVMFDGKEVGNPYIERDSVGGITKAIARKRITGLSPLGNFCVVDYTAEIDFDAAIKSGLMDVAKEKPDAVKIGFSDEKPTGKDGEPAAGRWRFIATQKVGGLTIGLWVNWDNSNVVKTLFTQEQRKNWAIRLAQTVAFRNAVLRHPAIGATGFTTEKNSGYPATHTQTVFFYRNSETKQQLAERSDWHGSRTAQPAAEITEHQVVGQDDMEAISAEVVATPEEAAQLAATVTQETREAAEGQAGPAEVREAPAAQPASAKELVLEKAPAPPAVRAKPAVDDDDPANWEVK